MSWISSERFAERKRGKWHKWEQQIDQDRFWALRPGPCGHSWCQDTHDASQALPGELEVPELEMLRVFIVWHCPSLPHTAPHRGTGSRHCLVLCTWGKYHGLERRGSIVEFLNYLSTLPGNFVITPSCQWPHTLTFLWTLLLLLHVNHTHSPLPRPRACSSCMVCSHKFAWVFLQSYWSSIWG